MRVRVYDVNGYGDETLRAECDLRECFPDEPDLLFIAETQLRDTGRIWTGGGASPLTLLIRV